MPGALKCWPTREVGGVDEPGEEARRQLGIIIKENDQVPGRLAHADVVAVAKAGVLRQPNEPEPRKLPFYEIGAVVG